MRYVERFFQAMAVLVVMLVTILFVLSLMGIIGMTALEVNEKLTKSPDKSTEICIPLDR